MHRRLSCPVMVGRAEELGLLRAALARAEVGEAGVVVIAGEAGIGKTRLVDEFAASAGPAATVLRGGCVPLADGLLAYAPVIELLRALGDRIGSRTLLELAGPHASALLRLMPDLAHDGAIGTGVETGADADRGLLFAAIRAVLERAAELGPLVAVLEDLHWADPSTRALLAQLAHDLQGGRGRLLLLCTYRTDDVSRQHPLRSLLAELDRRGIRRVELNRLTLADTTAQVAGVLGQPDAALAERVHARCGGNPFLVEELLAAGPQAQPLPEATRDILLQRIRRLPVPDQRLLHLVAVAGRGVDHRLLAKVVAATGSARMLEGLRRAVAEQILTVACDEYAFRHALVAEAVAAEALPGERIRVHRAYAEALTELGGDAAELAHHWCAAGDLVRGLIASIDAGLAAERLFAQSEARAHFDRAIQLWYEAPPARGEGGLDLVDLCRHGAQAAYLEGDISHAITLVRRALAEIDADEDRLRAGMLHERLGRYLWANADRECESIGAYERAVELVADTASAERARVLTGLAGALVYADRPDAGAWCREALQVARAAGARGEEGQALGHLGYCRAMAGDIEGGLDHCRQALAIATRLDHGEELYRAYSCLTGVLRMAGRTAEAASVAMEGVEMARRRGAHRTYGNLLLGDAVEALILLGRWDEADDVLPALPDLRSHGAAVIATNLWLSAANLHTWRGRFEEAQRFLDASSAAYSARGHGHVRSMLHVHLAELCLWQGRFDMAARWVRQELDLIGDSGFTSLLSRLVLLGLRAEAGRTRPVELDRLTDLLHNLARRPDPPPDAAGLIAMSWAERARAVGETALDRWDEAARHWSALELAWPLAYVRWRQAEALLSHRPKPMRRAGKAALEEAHSIAMRLRAEPLRREIESLARRTRLRSVLTAGEPCGDGEDGRADAGASAGICAPLTPREGEVLELVATGATNRQIARKLLISEKTVSIHVSRILTKLGVANRGEAAALAHQRGLFRLADPARH